MWSSTFLKSLTECTLLWVGTNQWSRQSGSSPSDTNAEREVEVFITLVSEFSWCSPISAAFSIFKHMFLFIKNFLLLLELSVNIHAHSVLAVFRRFSEDSLMHKHLLSIWLNNISCTAERILHLLNIDTSGSKLPIIINYSFRFFNLTDTSLLMNPSANLKLQRRCSFQYTVK